MKRLLDATHEVQRRLELVRQIARLNSQRTYFSREEEIQFIIAARVFTHAELHAMHRDAVDASQPSAASRDRSAF